MNSYTGTPTNCVCVCAFIAAMLGLLSFAGSAAIGAIFTMGIACQYICYCTPVVARFLGGQSFTPGPFNLGRAVRPFHLLLRSSYRIVYTERPCRICRVGFHDIHDSCVVLPDDTGTRCSRYELLQRSCRRNHHTCVDILFC